MKETHSKAETIIVSISMVVLAGVFVNIGNVFAILFRIDNQVSINLVLIFSSLIGFVAIPLLFLYYLEFKLIKPKFYIISAIVLSVLILFISIFIFQSEEIVHALIIATCEEFLFRVIILSVLLSCFKKRSAFVLGSLIFAILLHLNGDFLLNFVMKFPASVILYILADRFGLQSSIAFHWFYNICVGSIFG
ncbi:hypothetical protein BSR19_03145 [Streptococcus salivarius]|uniref:CAAX prenyl protease 2/Lysostaphin resistance protein A-like domain-containing protein n=1 Tax=Streptococcus salivarius TaxID=1304 RepID=A0AB37D9C1_STRSL|nr:type II CAAX endopeptidase family protein [Streptococcus salivarius]QGU80184.1 hypothetical protein BSR19_03145 [Streptococcus salivarius]